MRRVATLQLALTLACVSCAAGPRAKPAEHNAFTISELELLMPEAADGRNSFRIPARALPTPKPVDLDNFQIKWFGQEDPGRYDFVTIAAFVEECHVIALQELKASNQQAVLAKLLTELADRGHNYGSTISISTGFKNNIDPKKNNYEEYYAFLWNKDRVKLVV